MSSEAKVEIFMDGSCPFCRAVQARVEPFDKAGRLRFVDYNNPTVAALAPYPRERLDEEMHVRAADGSWQVGYDGWVAILRELPRLKWLGSLLGAIPFRWFGPSVYRWIARHRYRIPGFPAPCTADHCALPAGVSSDPSSIMRSHTK
jgi:predicted DCC family thiol-disulfide oxidoreductase YuxK